MAHCPSRTPEGPRATVRTVRIVRTRVSPGTCPDAPTVRIRPPYRPHFEPFRPLPSATFRGIIGFRTVRTDRTQKSVPPTAGSALSPEPEIGVHR
jgi:hypothetical protein